MVLREQVLPGAAALPNVSPPRPVPFSHSEDQADIRGRVVGVLRYEPLSMAPSSLLVGQTLVRARAEQSSNDHHGARADVLRPHRSG